MESRTKGPVSARRCRSIGMAVLLSSFVSTPALAQDWIVIQGIAGLEGWSTDDGSRLLKKNEGRPVGEGILTLWTAVQLHPKLQLMALGEIEGVAGVGSGGEGEFEVEQLALRFASSPSFVLEAGKILSPVGSFASRRFSTTNPVIGSPDSYQVGYPWGVSVTGRSGRFDYRAGLVSEPVINRKYLPEPTDRLRPAIGAGVTLATGFRVGASFTQGSYLNRDQASAIPQGAEWEDFDQRLVAFDGRFSRGHSELRAEFSLSSYDVPTVADAVDGKAGYLELKHTWSPRFFTAIRVEGNDYAFIRLRDNGQWFSTAVAFWNGEAGVGFWLSRDSLLKVSYRGDRWAEAENGYALAFQFSHKFDVMQWLGQGMVR